LELESSNLTRRPESGEKAGLTVEHHTKTLSGNDHDLALLPCCRPLFVNLSISFQKANTVRIKSASSILDNLKCPPTETWDTARYRSLPRRPRARWTVDSLPQADTRVLPKKRTQVAKSQGVPHSAHPVTRTLAGAPSSARVSPRCSSDTVIRFWHGMWGQLAAVAFSRLVSPRLQTLLRLQQTVRRLRATTARASEPRQLALQSHGTR